MGRKKRAGTTQPDVEQAHFGRMLLIWNLYLLLPLPFCSCEKKQPKKWNMCFKRRRWVISLYSRVGRSVWPNRTYFYAALFSARVSLENETLETMATAEKKRNNTDNGPTETKAYQHDLIYAHSTWFACCPDEINTHTHTLTNYGVFLTHKTKSAFTQILFSSNHSLGRAVQDKTKNCFAEKKKTIAIAFEQKRKEW